MNNDELIELLVAARTQLESAVHDLQSLAAEAKSVEPFHAMKAHRMNALASLSALNCQMAADKITMALSPPK